MIKEKKRRKDMTGYLFIAPAIIFFLVFIVYPIGFISYGSLFNWSSLSNMTFVGLKNFVELFQDKVFIITLRNTLLWILITITIQMVLGFILAYIIEEKVKKYKSFFRTLFFIPVVTSVVVISIVWSNMYSPYQGLLTNFLYSIGFGSPINLLGDVNKAIFAIMVVNIWEWTGWSMILYIAGLSEISQGIKEAALIDGAKGFKKIYHIFIPLTAHVHKSLVLLGIIGSLQTFALVYSMTSGGPNSATEVPGTYIFKMGFQVQRMGYASAISVIILLLALVLTVIQVVTLGSGNFISKKGGK